MKAKPHFTGDVTVMKQGTVGTAGNVSVGVSSVGADSARLELADGQSVERLTVPVGEAGSALGVSVRVCATWVDEHPSDEAGGDKSLVYVVYGLDGDAPACPALAG